MQLHIHSEIVKEVMIEEKLTQGSDKPQAQTQNSDYKVDSFSTYDDVFKQKQAFILCGFDSLAPISEVILGGISVDLLLDKQIVALDNLVIKCKNWYQYIDGLNESEKIEVRNTIKTFTKPNKWYESKIELEKRLQLAKDSLLDDPEGVEFSALYFLLQNDEGLLKELGRRIGSDYWEWIKSSSLHIVTFYNCSKYNNCTPGSLTMLSLCLNDEQYCGYSYAQYLAKIYSHGQFSDIQNIIIYLREIMVEGYPDIVFK